MPELDEIDAAHITPISVLENLFRLEVEKTKAHGTVPHAAFQMSSSSAAAVFLARIERDLHVAALPDTFVPGIDAEADAVTERPDADEPIQLTARGGEGGCNTVR